MFDKPSTGSREIDPSRREGPDSTDQSAVLRHPSPSLSLGVFPPTDVHIFHPVLSSQPSLLLKSRVFLLGFSRAAGMDG